MTARTRLALGLLFAAPAALAHDVVAAGGGLEILLLLGAAATAAVVLRSGRPLRPGRDVGDRV